MAIGSKLQSRSQWIVGTRSHRSHWIAKSNAHQGKGLYCYIAERAWGPSSLTTERELVSVSGSAARSESSCAETLPDTSFQREQIRINIMELLHGKDVREIFGHNGCRGCEGFFYILCEVSGPQHSGLV